MQMLTALTLVALCADPSDTGWKEAAKEDGVTVYSREKEGSSVKEMRAIGLIDGTPQAVWAAIRDYTNYTKTMPYTEESRVISVEDGGKVTYFYSVVNAPLVDRRDYTLKIVDDSDWQDGKGFMRTTWTAAPDKGPAEKDGLVRVKINDGYWKLEARDGGKKTFTTYYVYTDPGGSVPKWAANKGNSIAVPNVFASIRKVIEKGKAAP
jgi:hypothetical protein